MKKSKIIKILTLFLVAIMIVSSISPKVVSAKKNRFNISGTWKKGDYILEVDDKDMTVALYYNFHDKYNSNLYCWGIFEPWDINKNRYSIDIGDNLARYGFEAVVKKNKMKLKWSGGDDKEFKFLKGTWKRK